MEYWQLQANPSGETYKKLIRLLCDQSDHFYFVVRKELKTEEQLAPILQLFQPYLIDTYRTKQWAGTRTKGPAAAVYVMQANKHTRKLLQELADSLYSWIAPELPEDLTFFKGNREWFSCTTHEKYGGFSLHSLEEQRAVLAIPGLNVAKES